MVAKIWPKKPNKKHRANKTNDWRNISHLHEGQSFSLKSGGKKGLFWIGFLFDTAQVVWIGQSTISLGRCLEFITGTKRQPSETHS